VKCQRYYRSWEIIRAQLGSYWWRCDALKLGRFTCFDVGWLIGCSGSSGAPHHNSIFLSNEAPEHLNLMGLNRKMYSPSIQLVFIHESINLAAVYMNELGPGNRGPRAPASDDVRSLVSPTQPEHHMNTQDCEACSRRTTIPWLLLWNAFFLTWAAPGDCKRSVVKRE
jgi:hypothetical protein